MAIKWVKEINCINYEYDYDTFPSTNLPGAKVEYNTNNYSGTVTDYFEIVAKNTHTSNILVRLRNSFAEMESIITVPASTSAYTRYREAVTANNTYPDKYVNQSYGALGLYCKVARIIIIQSHSTAITSTETQIEIGSYEAEIYTSGSEVPLTYPKIWSFESDNWDGTCTWYAEVVWEGLNNKQYLTLGLQYSTDQSTWYTESWYILNNGTNEEAVTRTRVSWSSGPTDGRYYRMYVKNDATKGGYGTNIYCAKIICVQTDATEITKTESARLLLPYATASGGLLGLYQYWDPDEFDGVTVVSYHEIIFGSNSPSTYMKLQYDLGGTPTDITNSEVSAASGAGTLKRGASAMTMPGSADVIDVYSYLSGYGWLSRVVHIISIAASGYTLTAAAGTHSVTGTAAGLLQSIIFSLAAGTHSVTGTAADLLISYLLSAAEGVHAVTGTAANFLRSYAVLANAGIHSVSGTAAGTLYSRIFSVDPGTHSVVGTAAGLSKIFVVLAESGTYVVTGTAADLLQSIILEAGVGVHSVTGTAAGVLYSRVFGVDPGTHSLTGTVVDFLRSYLVDASPGSHSLSGSEVDFLRSYLVDAGVGSHSVTGSDVNFLRSLIMSLAAGVHSVTGTDAILEKLVGYVLNADPGTYLVTGPAAQLLYSRIMSVDSGTHSVTGTAADIFRLFTLQANAGIVSVTGTNADLLRSMLLDAQAGTHSLTGTEADLLRSLLLNAEAGTVNLVGTDADLLMSRLLSAVPGVVSVSGTDADLLRSLLLSAGVGSYSVVGTDADLLLIQGYVLQAESGTYVVTGVAADLIYSGTGVKPDYIILHRRRRRT